MFSANRNTDNEKNFSFYLYIQYKIKYFFFHKIMIKRYVFKVCGINNVVLNINV